MGTPHPYVPFKFCNAIFSSLHSLSHPKIRGTQKLVTACFIWPNINTNVYKWARFCLQCQYSKVHWHIVSPMSTFANPNTRFNHVHVDLVDPLPLSQGCWYLLMCVDRFTQWPETIPVTDNAPKQQHMDSWVAGFQDLGFLQSFVLTEVSSLNLPPNRTSWIYSHYNNCLAIIPVQMDFLKDFIVNWKWLWKQGETRLMDDH